MGTLGPYFPGKLGTPLGKRGPVEPVLQKWEKVSSYIFHKKSRLENNAIAIFPMVATPMVVLYQVRLDSYLALRKLRTKYFCRARDGDNFCVGDHQVNS